MSSTLQSTTPFVPPQDLTTWLGRDIVSPFSNTFGHDLDELLLQESPSLDSSSSYSTNEEVVPSFEFVNRDEQLLALPDQCVGYNDYPMCSYNQFGENSFGVGYYQQCDTGDVAYSTYQNNVSPNIYDTVSPLDIWGFKGRMISSSYGSENSSPNKVGRYSVEERRARIRRYLNKRNQRNFRKTIKYACRKSLADRRVRIRGRFAKNQEEESHTSQVETMVMPFLEPFSKNEEYGLYSDQDYWLQEAIETLTHGSVAAGPHAW